jgi:hypothetical protein
MERCAERLGFTANAFQRCLSAPTTDHAKANLTQLTKSVKKTYRRLSRELHPDHNPGCPEKVEQFKELSLAYSDISAFLSKISFTKQQPTTRIIVRAVVSNKNTADSCSSSSFTSNWWARA